MENNLNEIQNNEENTLRIIHGLEPFRTINWMENDFQFIDNFLEGIEKIKELKIPDEITKEMQNILYIKLGEKWIEVKQKIANMLNTIPGEKAIKPTKENIIQIISEKQSHHNYSGESRWNVWYSW
jgi:hypothetical protein